jgi:uncharacterized protein (TIGR03083 family)
LPAAAVGQVRSDLMSGLLGELRALARRSLEICSTLASLTDSELRGASLLHGWSRLTIACHLRYGAEALTSMTTGALCGQPAAFYPGGRTEQRPTTLLPHPGERPAAVVASLKQRCDELQELWSGLSAADWETEVTEPPDRRDLGPLSLRRLLLLRLTEVEVHGSDLGVDGLRPWSNEFVGSVLPFRLDWLNQLRTNRTAIDRSVQGTWLLATTDGPCALVSVAGDTVTSHTSVPVAVADATLRCSSRDLLALLLGRPTNAPLEWVGNTDLGAQFKAAFPGP